MTPEFAPASDATLPLWLVWTGDPLPQDAGDWQIGRASCRERV